MSEFRKNLLRFFDRPMEPCFMRKGDKSVFKIPQHYYPKDFTSCANRVDDRIIDIESVDMPDLSLPMEMSRDEPFSLFLMKHREMAARLIEVFMSMPDCKSLQSICAYSQLHMNPYLFNYCLSFAILHRDDTKGMDIPTFAETFPEKFVDRKTLHRARELVAVLPEGVPSPEIVVELPEAVIPEQRLAYFREDIGLNSHHWHWHLIYPTDAANADFVNKDRRGELFYYMHRQLMIRYNTERMCNGLSRTTPYKDFSQPIPDGYFPRLDSKSAARPWAPRFDNTVLRDVDRPDGKRLVKLADMDIFRDRILQAIDTMTVLNAKTEQYEPLEEETGIDILGKMMEATMMSINPNHYGDFHNMGHMLIAYVHDPDGYHSEPSTVMGGSETAMRDPVFYRWHAYIDEIFTMYKDKLTPYGPEKLVFPEVIVSSIRLESVTGQEINHTISTLWERSTMNLMNSLDFSERRNVYARFTHLQHEDFRYVIEVDNTTAEPQVGTVRIFMAPTHDEKGNQYSFEEQRNLMIEMDKFSQPLHPGKNTINRSSTDSSVTIPFERIFRDQSGESSTAADSGFNYCDCGWPQYLLVPKGTVEGYPMVLFVMVSNWKEDKVDVDLTGVNNDNASFCGLRNRKYPDRRAMGFPFDRKLPAGIDCINKFLQPNMAYRSCTIKFTNNTRDRVQSSSPEKNKNSKDNHDHCETGEDSGRGRCGWPRAQCPRIN